MKKSEPLGQCSHGTNFFNGLLVNSRRSKMSPIPSRSSFSPPRSTICGMKGTTGASMPNIEVCTLSQKTSISLFASISMEWRIKTLSPQPFDLFGELVSFPLGHICGSLPVKEPGRPPVPVRRPLQPSFGPWFEFCRRLASFLARICLVLGRFLFAWGRSFRAFEGPAPSASQPSDEPLSFAQGIVLPLAKPNGVFFFFFF